MCIALDGKRDLVGCDYSEIAAMSLMCKMTSRHLMNLLSCLGIVWTAEEMKEILIQRHRIAKLPNPICR